MDRTTFEYLKPTDEERFMCATCDAAWAAFERWLENQSDDVQDLPITEQIELYANDE